MLSRGELEGRFDPAFYTMKIVKLLKHSIYDVKTLKEVVIYIKSGFASGKNDQAKDENGIIQIRPTNLDNNGLLKFDKNIYVPSELLDSRERDLLQKDEVLFNNTNSQEWVGKTGYFNLDDNYFCSNHITRIKTNNLVKSKYLWILLNVYQKYKVFFNSCTNWNNQSGIGNELLKSYKIPVPHIDIQEQIINIMDSAFESKKAKEQKAKELLDSIDDYLLNELGIVLPPEPENSIENRTFELSFEDVFNNRVDSNYHKPYYVQLEEALESGKYNLTRLKEIIEYLDYGLMPTQDYAKNSKDGLAMIRVTNITKDGYIDMSDTKYIKFDTPRLNKKLIQENDVLMVQCGSTTGKCAIVDKKYKNFTFGSFSFGIRGKKDKITQYFLFTILNSKIIQKQLERSMTVATVRPNTTKPDVLNLKIPLPPLEIQNKIANEIKKRRDEAKQLQKEAKEELQKAKDEVERIILGES